MSSYDADLDTAKAMERTGPLASMSTLYAGPVKRILDLFLVLLILPVILPLIALLAICVALDGGNPFYSQLRVGRDGRHFRMWKLRSMVSDADARLEAYLNENPAARAEWDSKQKLFDDPRITPLGHVIRKTSMDELPQIFNVLWGDMSFVGPRPMMVQQQQIYPGLAYFNLRPGITGPWQVSDRNGSTFAARAEFDNRYYETLSFRQDIWLLLATVRIVFRGTGR